MFDYLADAKNELEWNPKVELMQEITDGPIGVGTKFRAKWIKSRVVTMECTAYDRPSGWGYVNDGPVTVELTISLAGKGDGTKLTSGFEAHLHGGSRLSVPIFILAMGREESRSRQLLKRALDSRAMPSSDDDGFCPRWRISERRTDRRLPLENRPLADRFSFVGFRC